MVWIPVLALVAALVGQDQAPQTRASDPSPVQGKINGQSSAVVRDAKSAVAAPQASAPKLVQAPAPPGPGSTIRVRTRAEMQKRSPFLIPPGELPADRPSAGAANPPDWNDIPPWRQASFFGIRARGQLFVYVVDCSGSMIDDDRLTRATIELRRSVLALQSPQRFEVIFYNEEAIPMPGGPTSRPAEWHAKNQLLSWLRLIGPDGGTDPRPALRQAIAMRPDAVFLLSDGAFPEGTVEMVTRLNTHKIPIHCVDLSGGLAGDHLKRIAEANGGRYASRPGDLQGRR